MRKFIRYYKNIVQSLTQTLNPLVPIFISKYDMQEKETITSNREIAGSRVTFCSTSAEPRYCVTNSPPLETGMSHLRRLLVKADHFNYLKRKQK